MYATREKSRFDTIVIGSGFGGTMAAERLIAAGQRVLMLERGDWVERGPQNWTTEGVFELTTAYSTEAPYFVYGERRGTTGAIHCVGGPSVFYGAASLRFRERDFAFEPEIAGSSGAAWPYEYADLEPYYTHAERLLGVAGEAGHDPTEPPRSAPFPRTGPPLSAITRMIHDAATRLGHHPFRLPLAINYAAEGGRSPCSACGTCDGYACAASAKNDLATGLLPDLIRRGLDLRPNTVAVRLLEHNGRITAVRCVDRLNGRILEFGGESFILAAGALGSPQLVLGSGLQHRNPAGHAIGRYLMRHANAMVYGVFRQPLDPDRRFHKQVAVHDFYFGDPARPELGAKLGCIQQVHAPPAGLIRARLPFLPTNATERLFSRTTGLMVIAEDQPRAENRVELHPHRTDRFGLPRLVILHRYTERDRRARRTLAGRARAILREAGAIATFTYPIRTFSHAVGTLRIGLDERFAPLDPYCRFRGVENLAVIDGSFMPTSAGVNPSLTIAANALRAAEHLAGGATRRSGNGRENGPDIDLIPEPEVPNGA